MERQIFKLKTNTQRIKIQTCGWDQRSKVFWENKNPFQRIALVWRNWDLGTRKDGKKEIALNPDNKQTNNGSTRSRSIPPQSVLTLRRRRGRQQRRRRQFCFDPQFWGRRRFCWNLFCEKKGFGVKYQQFVQCLKYMICFALFKIQKCRNKLLFHLTED